MSGEYLIWAFALGGLSAISLPLGSLLGLFWRPKPSVTGIFTAFGGGALLAALSVELVAPTAAALVGGGGGHGAHGGDPRLLLISMIVGAVIGGLLFIVLDQLVNEHGGFLRKTATTMAFFSKARLAREKDLLGKLSAVPLLRSVPVDQVTALVETVRPASFPPDEVIFEEGSVGDRMLFIESGNVLIEHAGEVLQELGPGDVVGEIALLTGAPRTATARTKGSVKALQLWKGEFDRLRASSPELEAATAELASGRLDELATAKKSRALASANWAEEASRALQAQTVIPSIDEVREAKDAHGAPLAIWLGILLDGVPESFVIGASLAGALAGLAATTPTFAGIIPYTLIAGLFLSNFPEAMSSSVGMRAQGWSRIRVFMMWFVLMVVTSLGAGVGFWLGQGTPEWVVVGIEGLAAGAMLTMIVSAMIPEAIHLSGSMRSGLGTLAGFLTAVAFKLLE